jgi:hypothetical protein
MGTGIRSSKNYNNFGNLCNLKPIDNNNNAIEPKKDKTGFNK